MIATRNCDRKAPGKFYFQLQFDYLEQAMVNAKIVYEANVQPNFPERIFAWQLLRALPDRQISVKGQQLQIFTQGQSTTYPSLFLTGKGVFCVKTEDGCKSIMGLHFPEL